MDTQHGYVRKFTSSGTELGSWGSGGLDLAVDAHSNVYVADMSSNHVVVFDSNGTYLTRSGN